MNLGVGFDVFVVFVLVTVSLLIVLGVSFVFNINWLSALGVALIILIVIMLLGSFIHYLLNKFKRGKDNDKK